MPRNWSINSHWQRPAGSSSDSLGPGLEPYWPMHSSCTRLAIWCEISSHAGDMRLSQAVWGQMHSLQYWICYWMHWLKWLLWVWVLLSELCGTNCASAVLLFVSVALCDPPVALLGMALANIVRHHNDHEMSPRVLVAAVLGASWTPCHPVYDASLNDTFNV